MLNLRAALAFGHGGAVAGLGCLITLAAPASADAQVVAFTGATVWDGTGASARPGSTIVVERGRIADVGPDAAIPPGADVVSLTGKFVIPGLVNAHGHATGNWAPDPRAEDAERVREDLLLYARYGVTSVNSLGDGTAALAVARAQDPAPPHARLMAAGPVVIDREPAGARATARENVRHGAAWLKLRVDDNLGTSEPMPWNAVEAVFEVGRETGVPVATHLFYLDDARRLLDMGTGLVAHSVRDTRVDDGFARRLAESGICYVPTLTRELSTFVYADRPSFFDDPFFQRHALDDEVHRLEHPTTRARYRDNPTAEGYRVALERAVDNLVLLHEAGVRIAFGTDSGPAGRFPGYFEHLELSMMVAAGLTPSEALASATSVAADCSGFQDVGTLEPGHWADFLVLGADPTVDIEATRSLERVYIGGREIPGAAGGR